MTKARAYGMLEWLEAMPGTSHWQRRISQLLRIMDLRGYLPKPLSYTARRWKVAA